MQKFGVVIKGWLPVVLWMALIFSFSSDAHSQQHSSRFFEPILRWLFPRMSPVDVEKYHHYFRKCGHLTEYAILGMLVFRGISWAKPNLPAWSRRKIIGTLLIVFLFASTDEIHQIFVPTRTPLVSDVIIDTIGGSIGLGLYWLFTRRKHKPEDKK